MSSNILITGAAGYIGGSLVTDLRSRASAEIKAANVIAAVRSREQFEALSKKGINVIQLDLGDKQAVIDAVLKHNVDLVVHCASGIMHQYVLNLIQALGKRREISGQPAYFIHTSGGAAYAESGGWPHGNIKDTDQVFAMEKAVAESNPIRKTNVTVVEESKAHGVTSFNLVPVLVYGRGTGEWNKLSLILTLYIKASIAAKQVYKFPKELDIQVIHMSDLSTFYALLIEKILRKETIPNGEEGYYFGASQTVAFSKTLDRIATALYSRKLVSEQSIKEWPSDEKAAELLGLPLGFVKLFSESTTLITPAKNDVLGWKPVWDNEAKFLESMEDEVQAVLELGGSNKSSASDALNSAMST